jgi:2-amino-4-hydroxy-6-hydroxymethyldihydropteridine diphosphokinase
VETEPVGPPGQPPYLNLAAEIETDLDPLELLKAAKDIEARLGREAGVRWGPRPIDIDIVLWGDRIVDLPELAIPHREFRNRAFVLVPLAQIAPDAVDPVTGRRIEELARAANLQGQVLRGTTDH